MAEPERYRYDSQTVNDILKGTANLYCKAIWDNRSVFHSATFDYEGEGERFGNRAVGVGERPYYDPESTSRRAALAART